MSRCACEGTGSLKGVRIALRSRDGRTFADCGACGRTLAVCGTLECAELFARGCLLTEEAARRGDGAPAEMERQRQRILAGLCTEREPAPTLSEEQQRQRKLAGLPV